MTNIRAYLSWKVDDRANWIFSTRSRFYYLSYRIKACYPDIVTRQLTGMSDSRWVFAGLHLRCGVIGIKSNDFDRDVLYSLI